MIQKFVPYNEFLEEMETRIFLAYVTLTGKTPRFTFWKLEWEYEFVL